MSEYVYLHPQREPYGGPEWRESLKAGRLDWSIGGRRIPVRQEGEIDGKPRFVCDLDDEKNRKLGRFTVEEEARQHYWYPAAKATEIIVDEAARAALRARDLEALKQPKPRNDKELIDAELERAGEEMGIIDKVALKLVNLSNVRVVDGPDGPIVQGVREAVAALRSEKPHHFHGTGKEAEIRRGVEAEVRKPKLSNAAA